jgi:type I restriction enzyme S subunit
VSAGEIIDAPMVELRDLTEPERPITYGVVKPGVEDAENGVVFIRGGDVAGGAINEANLRTITQEVSRPYARTILRGGELVMSLVGNPGEVAVVPDRLAGANLARQVGLIALRKDIHAPYVKYYLMGPHGRAELFQRTQGAVQQVINLADLKRVKVRLPPCRKQIEIAGILSAYDDLIENNRRRIALLEDTARLLYREWFVHFRFPGHEHAKFIDGLPDGWQRQTFGDVCESIGGGTPATGKPEFWTDGDIPWYTPTDITRNSCLALLDSATKITEAGLHGSSAKMLPAGTVLMTSRASVGFFGIIDTPACTNQGFISIVPHDERERMYLLHNLMQRVEEIRSHAGGATYKEINKSKFRALDVTMPCEKLLQEFEEQATTLHEQVRNLHAMNQKLAQARDLLLPRLMSGELAI